MHDLVRTHIVLPRELLEQTDRIVGERKRSELVVELLSAWLRRERQRSAIRAVLAETQAPDDNVPEEWLTPEDARRWVHEGRRATDRTNANPHTAAAQGEASL